MTSQIAISISAAVIALMAAWAWRSSVTPVWVRIALPVCAMAACWLIPVLNASMADAERVTTLAEMPRCFVILAMRAHDSEATVSLWIDGSGRVVSLPLDRGLKDTLRQAQAALAKGEPGVRICKDDSNEKHPGKGGWGFGEGSGHGGKPSGGSDSKMVIDKSLFLENMKEKTE